MQEPEAEKQEVASPVVMDFMTSGQKSTVLNHNGKILELFKQGKSEVEIAKEMGLGVGEVKLVVDLYDNMIKYETLETEGK